MWRTVRVRDIVHFQCVALFLITLFELNLGLYSSLLNCVPYVLTCQRALRAYVLTCQRALRAYVLTC